MKILLYGSSGWIGTHIKDYIQRSLTDIIVYVGVARCDNKDQLTQEISTINPNRIIASIGRAYGKNMYNNSFIEDSLTVNIKDNLIAPLTLANACNTLNVHCTFIGSGCVYKSASKLYSENDEPSLISSNHAIIKSATEKLIQDS